MIHDKRRQAWELWEDVCLEALDRAAYIRVEENELPDMLVTGESKAYATSEIDATSYDVSAPVGYLNFMDRTSP